MRPAIAALVVIVVAALATLVPGLGADARPAAGQPINHGDCTGAVVGIVGTADLVTYSSGSDVVTGVCIKSGANMFGGDHSSLINQDVAGLASCYSVDGIGTSIVTVTRTGQPSDTCQAISHIDVTVGQPTPTPSPTPPPTSSPTPPPTASPTPTPTPTALGEVQAPHTQEPQALPATGGAPSGGGFSPLPLIIVGLALVGAAAIYATRLRRG